MGEAKAQRKGASRGVPLAAGFGGSAREDDGGDGRGRRFAPILGRGWQGKRQGCEFTYFLATPDVARRNLFYHTQRTVPHSSLPGKTHAR